MNNKIAYLGVFALCLASMLSCTYHQTNEAPASPYDPFPSDKMENLSTDVRLNWSCEDPEGDPIRFDIYFGNTNNPEIVVEDLFDYHYDTSGLMPNTTYFWKIKAKDDHTNRSDGPVWSFTTQ